MNITEELNNIDNFDKEKFELDLLNAVQFNGITSLSKNQLSYLKLQMPCLYNYFKVNTK